MTKYLGTYCSKDIIKECIERYGLVVPETVPFITWPVFMDTAVDNINICAVNFGLLTLLGNHDNSSNGQQIKEYINAAVNVLVVTNLKKQKRQEYRYWPTTIDYSNKIEWGTINQASLSLTSLFKYGFLEKQSILNDLPLDSNMRFNRFVFFAENLNWILSLQNNIGNECAAWSYAENCKDVENEKSITTAIVPSQFCYELVSRLYDYFVSCEENRRIIDKIDPNLLIRMSDSCRSYENWIANTQKEDGGYGRNNNFSNSSFAHSCCAMLTYVYNDHKETKKRDSERLNRLVSYLIRNYKKFNFDICEVSDSYKFQYEVSENTGYVNDVYEVFPETLFLINCCKNIDDDKNALIKWYYKRFLRIIDYRAYEKLFARLETIQINDTNNNLVVKGRQQLSRKYPIYALYYTYICLRRLKNNDELPWRNRKKYISLPLIVSFKALILFLLLAGCVLAAYIINPSDTLSSIILSIAAVVFPALLHMFSKNDK